MITQRFACFVWVAGFLVLAAGCSRVTARARAGAEPRVSFAVTFSSRDGSRTTTLVSGKGGTSSAHYALAATGNGAISDVSLTLTDDRRAVTTFDGNAVPSDLTLLSGVPTGASENVTAEIRFNYLDSTLVYEPFDLNFPATITASTDPADGATVYAIAGSAVATLSIPDDVLGAVQAYEQGLATPVTFTPNAIKLAFGGISISIDETHIMPSGCIFGFTAVQPNAGSPAVDIGFSCVSGPCTTLQLADSPTEVTPQIPMDTLVNGGEAFDVQYVLMRDTATGASGLVGLQLDINVVQPAVTYTGAVQFQ